MLLFNWLMPVLFVAARGPASVWALVRTGWLAIGSSLGGGVVSVVACGIVVWALQSGAMGVVSGLREASMVFFDSERAGVAAGSGR
jgi:hypothetical protein